MSKPITLFRPRRSVTSDDGGTTIVKYELTKPLPAPYETTQASDVQQGCYIPSLQSMCLKTLTQYPNQIHALEGIRIQYKPPEEEGDYDLLRELIPAYSEEDPDSISELLKTVDPRLWATLIQVYSDLPESFRIYRLPLSDAHLPLLQDIPNTPHFSLITVLELRSCKELDDTTIVQLGQLHGLAALDIGATALTPWGVKILAKTLVKNPEHSRVLSGPWGLRILSLQDCMKITDEAIAILHQFPLLSVIDLRGTCCTPTAYLKTPFAPSADDTLYHPAPLRDALSTLASKPLSSKSSYFYSHPGPFFLHIDKLEHQVSNKHHHSRGHEPRRLSAVDVIGSAAAARISRAPPDVVTLVNRRSSTGSGASHRMNMIASLENQRHAAESAAAAFYSAFGSRRPSALQSNSRPAVFNHQSHTAPRRPKHLGSSRGASGTHKAPDGLRLYREPPPWSVLVDVQAASFEEAASKPASRSRGQSDDRPQSSPALVESLAARQSMRAVFGLLEKRIGSSKPTSSSGEASSSKAIRVNPFSREMVRNVFATSNAKAEPAAPPADPKPAHKKRRVSLETGDAQEEVETVPKSTLVIPPRSTKPLKHIFDLPVPIFPEQEAAYKQKHKPKAHPQSPAPAKPSPSAVQSKLSSFASDAVPTSRAPGAGFRPDKRGDTGKPSKTPTKIGAGGSGSGEPSGAQQQPVLSASKKKRKSTDSSRSFDWKSWGS